MRNVPPADRCRCAEVDKKSPGAPKSAEAGGAAPQPSLWDRLLGR